MDYADIIIDISHEKVDRPFQYRIPDHLKGLLYVGSQVDVPFGRGSTLRTGYVVGFRGEPEIEIDRIKPVYGIHEGSVSAESQLIQVAWWMKERYGSTMNQALKTVLPVKQQVKSLNKRWIRCLLSEEALKQEIAEAGRKKYRARYRLLSSFLEQDRIPYEAVTHQLNLTPSSLKPLLEKKIIALDAEAVYRTPVMDQEGAGESGAGTGRTGALASRVTLNDQQQAVVSDILSQYQQGIRKTYLIHGITGSGKTEVYMELIQAMLDQGKQVILLIPEIALTYQTVMRFYRRFGDGVSFINSRLSAGERYDQFERARKGEIQIMIGPRSALFTPFQRLGMILIDEEHEGAYKSETTPRYHAGAVAEYRAGLNHASVILGSATPSVESYTKAMHGIYGYYRITKRAKEHSFLPSVDVVDLREELRVGNKSVFSRRLYSLMEEKLAAGEQIMLFLNRRGYSRFLSCRACGEAIKCPHCDVTLTLHQDGRLVCHYCGFQKMRPKTCPSCGSAYLAPFGSGTQKIEALTKECFPNARILRMDLDTTSKKGSHEEILSAFASHEADILIGTQMIVKGHDFPAVTLVGILAADLSLYAPDYRSGERTFQLLTQAAGRAGRDDRPGSVVIQSYSPDHYCIRAAAEQNYEAFYEKEMEFRRLLHYPPVCVLMTLLIGSRQEAAAAAAAERAAKAVEALVTEENPVQLIGPVNAPMFKLNDIYRKILYMKCENYDILIKIRNQIEFVLQTQENRGQIMTQFDFT